MCCKDLEIVSSAFLSCPLTAQHQLMATNNITSIAFAKQLIGVACRKYTCTQTCVMEVCSTTKVGS